MRIHPGKLVNIVIVCFMFGIGGLVFLFSTKRENTQVQADLSRFYESRLDSCVVLKLDSMKYDGNRGYTPLAYTKCSPDYFSLMLDEGDADLVRRGVRMSKEGNSVDFIVFNNKGKYKLKLRHPDYYNMGSNIIAMVVVLAILVIGILISPNKQFERLSK